MCRVGQNHTFRGIYSVHTVFLAGKSPYVHIRCRYTVLANPVYVSTESWQGWLWDAKVRAHKLGFIEVVCFCTRVVAIFCACFQSETLCAMADP